MEAATIVTGSPVIARWVDGFWAFESTGAAHRVLPDGCIDFIFDLDTGRATVQGPMTRVEVISPESGRRLFGVRFLPGAAGAFVDAPAHALEDRDADLDDLTSARSWRIAERIAEATDHKARQRLVSQYLLDPRARKRTTDARLHQAVTMIRQSRGASPVAATARAIGVSDRTLERLFRDQVGVGPKLFGRIMRMQWTRRLAAEGRVSQANVALRAGYADESHLVREFRALTGLTLGALLAEDRVGFVQVDGSISEYPQIDQRTA